MNLDLRRALGLSGVILILILGLFAPLLSTQSPLEIHWVSQPQSPSAEHLAGTDQLGRDIYSRSLYALRESLLIVGLSSLLIIALGTLLGTLGGYFGGVLDWGVVAVLDCMLAFPALLLTIAISATLGPGHDTLLVSLIASGWAPGARIIRSTVQGIKAKEFVTASRLLGAGHIHILLAHILPHCARVMGVVFTMTLASTLLAESSLSFLGFGLPPPHPTLGRMVYEGARFFRVAPWWSFFPGLLIALAIISFNLLGDSLQKEREAGSPPLSQRLMSLWLKYRRTGVKRGA